MNTIIRKDGTKLRVEHLSYTNSKIAVIISGYGYTTNHPLLYYSRAVANQNHYDSISIDFDYLNNDTFLNLCQNLQDQYFNNDIELLVSEIRKLDYSEKLYIGKSMGTTAINRFIASKIIGQNDKLVFITPGDEWNQISERLKMMKNYSLVIGSLADPKYASIDLKEMYSQPNIEFLEFHKENHGLERSDYKNDIEVVFKVSNKINELLNK